MICVHCGLCCYDYTVVIIDNKFIDFDGEDANNLPQEAFVIKSGNEPCPYLEWSGDNSKCKVHNKPWFKSTPCYDFGQVENDPNTVCRLGQWIVEKRKTDSRFNYRLKCETFVEPRTPKELINGSIFQNDSQRKADS